MFRHKLTALRYMQRLHHQTEVQSFMSKNIRRLPPASVSAADAALLATQLIQLGGLRYAYA